MKFSSVLAGKAFNSRVRSLPGARIKKLHAMRLGFLGGGSAFAVKNDDDANAGIVLVIPEFFDERIACE